MKFIIAFAAILTVAAALPTATNTDKDAVVLRYENDNIGVGHYNYLLETSDGVQQQQHGELKTLAGSEQDSIVVRGSYSYVGPDGQTYTVTYIADENGFQPSGAHIPTK